MDIIFIRISFLFLIALPLSQCNGQKTEQTTLKEDYSYRTGNPNGIGKWYKGREIAHVMGFQGMSWLERPERETEENTSKLLLNMTISPDDTIADIGAGSGYHVFKMATKTTSGLVYGIDIQQEMLDEMQRKKSENTFENISLIKGSEKSVNLPKNSVNKVLMVDVYHEFNYPIEMLASIASALKKDGKVYLIEYRGEDTSIPIKNIHKMTEAQAVKEFEANGFTLEKNINNLPWQHCMVFVKK